MPAPVTQPFNMSYLDGSTAIGKYSLDTIKLDTARLPNSTFGLVDQVDVTPGNESGPQYGILGLGTKMNGVMACPRESDHCEGGFEVPTLHDALYSAGYIRSRSYSLWLQHSESGSGNILFGGVDRSRFTGPLVTLNTLAEASGHRKGKHLQQ